MIDKTKIVKIKIGETKIGKPLTKEVDRLKPYSPLTKEVDRLKPYSPLTKEVDRLKPILTLSFRTGLKAR